MLFEANETKEHDLMQSGDQVTNLSGNLLFASETMGNIILFLTCTFSQNFRTFYEMETAVKLLHEFDWCGGYRVFTDLMVHLSNQVVSSDASKHASEVFSKLLKSYFNLLSAVINCKTIVMHASKCSRRNHRSCSALITNLVPVHCEIMGSDVSMTSQKDRETCVIAVGVRFLIDILIKISPQNRVVDEVVTTLDKACLCSCQPICDWLVPLLCLLPRWSEPNQRKVLSFVSKLMVYHFCEIPFSKSK